jgi:hypothetical protein
LEIEGRGMDIFQNKRNSGTLILGATALLLCRIAAGAEPVPQEVRALWVEEAQAVVELYEVRLYNVKRNADQEDLKWNLVKENYARMEEADKSGAINERNYREAKYEYDYWRLKDEVRDIQEAEANLKLAQIRLKMAKAGFRPYGKVSDYGRE